MISIGTSDFWPEDLACPSLALDGPKSLAFSARPSKVAANACVFECRFELPRWGFRKLSLENYPRNQCI